MRNRAQWEVESWFSSWDSPRGNLDRVLSLLIGFQYSMLPTRILGNILKVFTDLRMTQERVIVLSLTRFDLTFFTWIVEEALFITQGSLSKWWTVLSQCQGFVSIPLPCPDPVLSQQGGWVSARSWERHRQDSWPWLTKGLLVPYNGMLNNKSSGERGQSRKGHAYGILIPKQHALWSAMGTWEGWKEGRKLRYIYNFIWHPLTLKRWWTVDISCVNSGVIILLSILIS